MLQPRVEIRLLHDTLRQVNSDGSLHRKLAQQDPKPTTTASAAAPEILGSEHQVSAEAAAGVDSTPATQCPPLAYLDVALGTVKELPNPTCSGDGAVAYRQALKNQATAHKRRASWCSLGVIPPDSNTTVLPGEAWVYVGARFSL